MRCTTRRSPPPCSGEFRRSLASGGVYLGQDIDGDGLGAMWGREQAVELMREAGFGTVDVHNLPHDFQNCYYVCRP